MNNIIYRYIKCGIIRQNWLLLLNMCVVIFKLWFLLPSQILRCIVVDVMFIDASPKSRWIEKANKCNLRKLRSFMEFKSVRMNGPFSFKHKTIFKPGEGRVDINNFLFLREDAFSKVIVPMFCFFIIFIIGHFPLSVPTRVAVC